MFVKCKPINIQHLIDYITINSWSFWNFASIEDSIYIIIGETERNLNYNFKLEFQFCVMCPKLFILKEFYFLILKSNMGLHYKYSSKWVIKYKHQRV